KDWFRQKFKCGGTVEDHRNIALDVRELIRHRVFDQPVGSIFHLKRSVAENPKGDFHFEMRGAMAERLGYAPADLDRIPAESIESFVGYYFHLADVKAGETVVDLGSGSGMDTFIAALKVGSSGKGLASIQVIPDVRIYSHRTPAPPRRSRQARHSRAGAG